MKRNELKGIMKTIQNMIELRITKEYVEKGELVSLRITS